MLDTKVAKRYAKSILELSKETGVVDAVHADMKMFLSVCKQNHDLSLMLANPIIHSYKKLAVIKAVFEGRLNKLTFTFMELITKKGREKYIEVVAKEFIEQYKLFKGIQSAEITSAIGLDDSLRAKVYELIRQGANTEVELTEKVDKKLIGGFVLRMGDQQYDASIASELRKLTQTFATNPYVRKN
jgi:F-type H+-transporting ATPase subunit delta